MSSRYRSAKSKRLDGSQKALRVIGIAAFVLVLGTQSIRVVERNVHVSREVAQEQQQIDILQTQRDKELATIARLQRPDGAVPEIHSRLKFAAENEAIVFLRHPGDGANALGGP